VALIDQIKDICDRLAPLGWRELLKDVTSGSLDIKQKTSEALQEALVVPLSTINRDVPGFFDFDRDGSRGITSAIPSQSLLYHALASPRVIRDSKGALLKGFPTVQEIEAVENYIFAVQPSTLAAIRKRAGGARLGVVIYATEYRCCEDTPDGAHADLTFSRTGIARVGTARPKYLPDVCGYWPEDENNPHGFRVIPVRFTAWLASAVKGVDARVMRLEPPDPEEKRRTFWIPIHKLFDGPECIRGLDLSLKCAAQFYNFKLQRVLKSLKRNAPAAYPYVITDGLAELVEMSEFGRIAVVPTVQDALVRPAIIDGKPLAYRVPKQGDDEGFATYQTKSKTRDGAEIHP
jgi:hypothetical protein